MGLAAAAAGARQRRGVAGFVLSMVAAGLMLISVGLSSIVSIVCRRPRHLLLAQGKQRVERGETPKHGGLAQAGFITGIVTLVVRYLRRSSGF